MTPSLQDGFTAVTFTRKGCVISVAPVDEGDAEARAVKQALLAVGTAKQQAEAGDLSVLQGGIELRDDLDPATVLADLRSRFPAVTFTRKGRVISVAPGDEDDADARAVKEALLAVGTVEQQAEGGVLLRPP